MFDFHFMVPHTCIETQLKTHEGICLKTLFDKSRFDSFDKVAKESGRSNKGFEDRSNVSKLTR